MVTYKVKSVHHEFQQCKPVNFKALNT